MTPIWIAGTMSGTSCDGVDGALALTDGEIVAGYGPTAYRAYSVEERGVLRAAMAAAAGRGSADLRSDPDLFPAARAVVTAAHLEIFRTLVEAAEGALGAPPALLAAHGQTVLHRPDDRFTLQILDAAAIAEQLRLPVAHDFRTADVAAGGQGAPFASFHHFALLKSAGETRPTAVLNLGGVGNVSFVDPSADAPEAPGALLAFDTGPANALIDDWVLERTGARYDADGRLAAAGTADRARVARWKSHPYFAAPPPKSLDRDAFAVRGDLDGLSTEDGAATLLRFTVETVALAARAAPAPPARWLVTGGGRRNPELMRQLAEALAAPVAPIEALTVAGQAVDGDMLEACAFAQLGARVLAGRPLSAPGTTGVPAPTSGGRIARPAGG
ncbi:MAG: anhydro-N-acetylmuramic acid kinase [Pseudomonadota bacterium]